MFEKILKKVQSDVSSLEHINDTDLNYYCTCAIEEMNDIVGSKDVDLTTKLDIAYFRFLLYVKQDTDLSEANMQIYQDALKKVQKAKYIEAINYKNKSRLIAVGQRDSKWF